MAEDADVQNNEITLEDFNGDEQESPKTESSPVKEEAKAEPKEPEAAKADEETDEVTPDATKTEGKADAEADETEDKPLGKAEERKSQLNTEIRDLVSQRNTLRSEVEKANAEVYQPATEQELEAEGLTATDARVEALRQRIEVKDYNDRVADVQLTLGSESERVLQDFPMFNPDSTDFDKELSEEASELLQQNLILDPNTKQIIGSNVSPYQLYKTLARATGISATKGQIKGQQATEKQLANVDAPTSSAPPVKKEDPLMALWKADD